MKTSEMLLSSSYFENSGTAFESGWVETKTSENNDTATNIYFLTVSYVSVPDL